jgi:hypothetical protein
MARQVVCLSCADALAREQRASAGGEPAGVAPFVSEVAVAEAERPRHTEGPIASGTAGASARREFERRVAKRDQSIRGRHPKLGGLILAFSDDPQSTTAWETGARGEELLGNRLDELADRGVQILHDRRIRASQANIDHLAVSSAGVFVLDAKRYKGRPSLKTEGGILRPRTETLMVGTRKCNPLIDGMHNQLALVTAALPTNLEKPPITGMVVFVEANWPLFGGPFTTRGVKVLWPKKAIELIAEPGALGESEVRDLHRALAEAFPRA